MFDAVDFTGEMGGLLALAFAMGAAATWVFAQRTIIKMANDRADEREKAHASDREELKEQHAADRAELKAEIADLRGRVRELDDLRFQMAREK